jgi:hypothetical protein
MKRISIRCLVVLGAIATIVPLATSAAAQATVVVGTGNPDIDVPAVQAAVDQSGEVILKGHFSFNRTPTVPTALAGAGYPPATILVSKAVAISGEGDGDDMTTIEGGTIPFYVEAMGAAVTIHALRFVRPQIGAILVYAVSGLTIASCKIEGLVPGPFGSMGIDIDTIGNVPTPAQPGRPGNISGTLLIMNNDIDAVGGTALDNVLGIIVFSAGESPDNEVDIYVSGNHVKNTTEPAINFRHVGGRVHVENNVLSTGSISSQKALRPEVIRVANTGSYVIAHNSIECQWPDPEAIGIGVFSQFADWPMVHAFIVDNEVTMSPPPGTVFGALSAGIDVRGFAQGNVVANNRIRGRARAALAVDAFRGGIPGNNEFVLNRFDDFEASVADIHVGVGVMNTRVMGQGTVDDHGIGTVIVPLRDFRSQP